MLLLGRLSLFEGLLLRCLQRSTSLPAPKFEYIFYGIFSDNNEIVIPSELLAY